MFDPSKQNKHGQEGDQQKQPYLQQRMKQRLSGVEQIISVNEEKIWQQPDATDYERLSDVLTQILSAITGFQFAERIFCVS
jgi:hypothetical protein